MCRAVQFCLLNYIQAFYCYLYKFKLKYLIVVNVYPLNVIFLFFYLFKYSSLVKSKCLPFTEKKSEILQHKH